jgi:tetratricopeptide (TPR) repeat protein
VKVAIVAGLFTKRNMKINSSHFKIIFIKKLNKKMQFLVSKFSKTALTMTRLEQLMKYLGDSPNEPFLLFAIAKEYEGMDNKPEAFSYYEKLVAEHETYVGTYYHLGKLYEKINEENKALETYKQGMVVAQKQGDTHAYGELATAKFNVDDDDF